MTNTKYEELQVLVKKYGREALAYYEKVMDIGPDIVKAYATYLGGPNTAANAVPPDGDYDPRESYWGDAFDRSHRPMIYLELIRMGVCTEIGNQSDSGKTWVHTIVEFRPSGDGLELTVGSRAKKLYVGDNPKAVMGDICEAIFQDAREAFSLELDQAQRSKVGFTPGNN